MTQRGNRIVLNENLFLRINRFPFITILLKGTRLKPSNCPTYGLASGNYIAASKTGNPPIYIIPLKSIRMI
jgi:hypothetical protein